MMRRMICVAALALVLTATTGRAQEVRTVKIDNFSFNPATLTVPAGTHVVFENHDDLPHTVVIPDLKQHSQMLDTDDKYETDMTMPGTYGYFCSVHPMMKGEIIVTEK